MVDQVKFLERSLKLSEENLQSTIEELETSNEELQSTNEELMSTNEELQSTNEELHSVNEELYTVSAEHQRKNHELSERNKDLDVLLSLSRIGTIHLDDRLCLKRYSANAEAIFNILPQDIERPIAHITLKCGDVDLLKTIEGVHTTGLTEEVNVTVGIRNYLIRVLPYVLESTLAPTGVLLTIIDVTDMTNVHLELTASHEQYRSVVESTDSFIARWDVQSNEITFCNDRFATLWQKDPAQLIGTNIVDLRAGNERDAFLDQFKSLPAGGSTSELQTISMEGGEKIIAMTTLQALSADGSTIKEYQLVGTDFTQERRYSEALDALMSGFTSDEVHSDRLVDHVLSVALEFFELDTAVVTMTQGKEIIVKRYQSSNPSSYEAGQSFQVADTLSQLFADKDRFLAFDGLESLDANAVRLANNTDTKSFIGTPIHTVHGPYGTVCFSANQSRQRDYSANEINFCVMVGGWLGYILGYSENIEFASKATDVYKDLFYEIPSQIALTTSDGVVITASKRLCQTLDVSVESIQGAPINDFLEIDSVQSIYGVKSSEEFFQNNGVLRQSNGDEMPVLLSTSIKMQGTMQGVRTILVEAIEE